MKTKIERERESLDTVERFTHELSLFFTSLLNASAGNQIENLPVELFLKIISLMDLSNPENLTQLMYVSKTFCKVLTKDSLWKQSGYNSYQEYFETNRLNLIKQIKGEGVVWAHRLLQLQAQSTIKILLTGDGEVGKKLELAAVNIDRMGYAFDGGVQVGMHQSRPIMFFSRVGLHAGDQELIHLRKHYEGSQNTYSRMYTKNGQEGGAQVAFISIDSKYDFNPNQLVRFACDEQMAGKLIFVITDSPLNKKRIHEVLATSKYPIVADQFAGVIQPQGRLPQELFDSVVMQMMPLLHEKSLPCDTSAFLEKLSSDLMGLICEELDKKELNSLACVSKNCYSLFKTKQPIKNTEKRVIKEQENPLDNCSIM